MARDENAPISVEEADRIARDRSGGRMSIRADGLFIYLCRAGSSVTIELNPEIDLTTAEIERYVDENLEDCSDF
jgi:hypothetical protein